MRQLRILALFVWLSLVTLPSLSYAAADNALCMASVSGIINPAVADYLQRSVIQAERQACQGLVIKLNTPGGLTSSTWQIGETLLNAKLPVIVYVTPQGANAGSAGVFITYAAHIAAMSPNTNIGAAHPVDGSGSDIDGDLRDKITNDAVARITTWAKSHGRDPEWAEQAVRQSVSIGSSEALERGVINLVAQDDADLLRQLNGRQVNLANGTQVTLQTQASAFQAIEMTWLERLLHFLGDPTIATMLISLGSLGIYFEAANPGLGVGGFLGLISICLGLYGLSVLPLNTVGVVLLILAFVLFAIDIFATAHGALTVGGLASFVIGALLLVDPAEAPGIIVSRALITGLSVGLALIIGLSLWIMRRSKLVGRGAGSERLIGTIAKVRSAVAPEGTVFVDGALWQARSDDALTVGDQAEIVGLEGLTLIVRRVAHSGR
ncbi:NfeD family protein [Herpetosiphon llansteffanensis]|uniref:NfeD family protein n=1 Tax=Herpetosiphon llansteffanensis TaxID=2094568 RepID=UPI000D7D0D6C|nr:nodulation protein NfeD [Herpetosiphon llansteffanensis]